MNLHLLKDPQPLQRVYQHRPSNHKNILPQTAKIVFLFFIRFVFSFALFLLFWLWVYSLIGSHMYNMLSDCDSFWSHTSIPLLPSENLLYILMNSCRLVCTDLFCLRVTEFNQDHQSNHGFGPICWSSAGPFVCIHLKTMTVPAPEFSRQDRALRASPHWAMIACWQA